MKPATVKQLKQELSLRSQKELVDLNLNLSKFKKENKEYLTYLLFEADDEDGYILGIREEIDEEFKLINVQSYYYIKKSIRKILRAVKKYIRFSKKKTTEIELLLYFCHKMKDMRPRMERSITLLNLYNRQVIMIKKAIKTLHEDLQFDYSEELRELQSKPLKP